MQDEIENTAGTTTKAFLLGIGGVMLVLGILVLMPMFFTYLSEGLSFTQPIAPENQAKLITSKPCL